MSRAKGAIGEDRAIRYLNKNGFRVIERNFYSRFGEIDVVAFKEGVLHFIEVKSGIGEPIYQITPRKLSRITKTVEIYLQKRKIKFDWCIDALIVTDEVELVENVTM